jgi:flagellar FliJ protein
VKRFQFTLAKLLGYKQQVLDREKNSLAHLRRQQQQLADQKAELERRLNASNSEFCAKSAKGMTVVQITVFKDYHKSLSEQIKELEAAIEDFEQKIQKQLTVVIEATKEVSSLEKLEDKQLEDYNFKVQKADERFIEEYVNNAAYPRA